jgi:hypothetical protein
MQLRAANQIHSRDAAAMFMRKKPYRKHRADEAIAMTRRLARVDPLQRAAASTPFACIFARSFPRSRDTRATMDGSTLALIAAPKARNQVAHATWFRGQRGL